MKFGEYIKIKREKKAWSQPEAAEKAGIEQSYLSKIERGKSYPSEDIFNRLVEVFDIEVSELSSVIFPGDLDRLREIKEVRVNLLESQKSERNLVRGWLIAGLVCLMFSGVSFGVVLSFDGAQTQYHYRSLGVLQPTEPLTTFDVLNKHLNAKNTAGKTALAPQHEALLDRVDQRDMVTMTFKGNAFVKNVLDGRRFYQIYHQQETTGGSMRWFLIPALMFLFSGIASLFISRRWQ